jgi:hypothetical protein
MDETRPEEHSMSEPKPAAPASPEAAPAREPYEKPAVAWEEPLEVRPALMVACGKVSFGQPGCDAVQGS